MGGVGSGSGPPTRSLFPPSRTSSLCVPPVPSLTMGASDSKPEPPETSSHPEQPQVPTSAAAPAPKTGRSGKKICCSCPETKAARDDCVVMNGQDKCSELIEAHKACLRTEGFDIR